MSDSDDFYGEDRRDEKRTRKQNTKKKKNNDKVYLQNYIYNNQNEDKDIMDFFEDESGD
jgi:hypothetical protein